MIPEKPSRVEMGADDESRCVAVADTTEGLWNTCPLYKNLLILR